MQDLEVTLKVIEKVEEARLLGQSVVVSDIVWVCKFCLKLLLLDKLTNSGACDKCYKYQNLSIKEIVSKIKE